jgi:hypothetical protein
MVGRGRESDKDAHGHTLNPWQIRAPMRGMGLVESGRAGNLATAKAARR